jgi:hypothetical protein
VIRPQHVLVAILVAAAVALAGAANAYWSGSGGGAGSGSTADPVAVVLTPGTPVADLRPGDSSAVVLTITNPNHSEVHVGSLALDTGRGSAGYSLDSGHATCSVGTLGFDTQTNSAAGWTVPGRAGTTDGTLSVQLSDALTMSHDAANSCQGAIVTVYLTAGP